MSVNPPVLAGSTSLLWEPLVVRVQQCYIDRFM